MMPAVHRAHVAAHLNRMDSPWLITDTLREEDRAMSRIANAAGFVHLRVHSAYSLLEGALTIKQLAELAAADAMPALAITDSGP